MASRVEIGFWLVLTSLLAALAYLIGYGIVNIGWWCVLAVPMWVGLAMLFWDAFLDD